MTQPSGPGFFIFFNTLDTGGGSGKAQVPAQDDEYEKILENIFGKAKQQIKRNKRNDKLVLNTDLIQEIRKHERKYPNIQKDLFKKADIHYEDNQDVEAIFLIILLLEL